jgi:hypothetical protein
MNAQLIHSSLYLPTFFRETNYESRQFFKLMASMALALLSARVIERTQY